MASAIQREHLPFFPRERAPQRLKCLLALSGELPSEAESHHLLVRQSGYRSATRRDDMRLIVEQQCPIDILDLARQGAFDEGVTMWFPFLRLTTTRHFAHWARRRSPPDRPPLRIPIQWTHCRFAGHVFAYREDLNKRRR
jgi:mRNA-degrading endonuclease YafQ of YafQ-DinJ toxin-antitoxin module